MNRRHWSLGFAAVAVAACTYKEYNTYYEVQAPDAAAPASVAGGSGQSGAAGANTSGAGGSASGAGAGGTGEVEPDCTGCLRLTTSSNAARNLRLEFDGDQNFSQTQLVWRMRVRDFAGDVSLTFYAQSGSSADEQLFLTSLNLSSSSGWQDLGADFGAVPRFSLPQFFDGGVGGAGFDPGFPFDKSEVERIGVIVRPNVSSGVFTPLTIEIDSVTFSNRSELSTALSSNDAGFELVDDDAASIDGATLVHVGG